MNTFNLRRFAVLAAALVCVTAIAPAARTATADGAVAASAAAPASTAGAPPAPAAAPESAATPASTPEAAPDDQTVRHGRHRRHRRYGNDLVSIGHDSTLGAGQQADSVVAIAGSSTSAGQAGDVVSILGNTRVSGPVDDSAVAVLGNVYVDSKISGDVVAALGSVELGPHADIGGDVFTFGGSLQRDPAAIVHGDVQSVLVGTAGAFNWLHVWVANCLLHARPLALAPGLGWLWGLALAFLTLYIGLALLFPSGLMRCVRTLEVQPGQVVIAALVTPLLIPILVVLLCITIIGIAAVPFVVFSVFCAALFGKAVVLAWLGRAITGRRTTGALANPALAVLVGGAIVLALYLLPFIGLLVYQVLGLLGIGVVVYTLIVMLRARQTSKRLDVPSESPGAEAQPVPPSATSSSPSATSSSSAAPFSDTAHPTEAPASSTAAALPRAGFWIRMAALLIDGLLVGIMTALLHHGELFVLAAYGAAMWKLRGSTIGGIVLHLQVVRLDGRAVDWATAIVRALGCFLSLAVAGLGFFWIAFDDEKQAWHDKIAGTVVVRTAHGVSLV